MTAPIVLSVVGVVLLVIAAIMPVDTAIDGLGTVKRDGTIGLPARTGAHPFVISVRSEEGRQGSLARKAFWMTLGWPIGAVGFARLLYGHFPFIR